MENLIELSEFIKTYIKSKGLKPKPSYICYSWDDFFHTQPKSKIILKVRDVCMGIARIFPGEEDEQGRSEYYSEEGFSIISELSDVLLLGEEKTENWLDEMVKQHGIYLSKWKC
jgi:hypothetical protein